MRATKKILTLLLTVCLLFGLNAAFSEAMEIDLSDIQAKEGFSFSEDDHSSWVYYSTAIASGSNGGIVEIMLVSWGKDNKLTSLPEMRVFAWDNNDDELLPQKITLLIGRNMFDVHLNELPLGRSFFFSFFTFPL